MSNTLNRKQRRAQKKTLQSVGLSDDDMLQIKKEIMERTVERTTERMNKSIISALLIAMNTELGVGPARAEKVVRKIDELITNNEPEVLKLRAEKILKIELQ